MKHTVSRTLLWLCASLCLLLAAHSQAATRKYVTTPETSAVLTSSNTSYLSGTNLWVKGDSMTSYIDRVGKQTPVGGIVPKKAFSIPSVGTKLKGFLKGNLAQVAMSAAISGAIAAVGWVMSDDNTKVQKKRTTVDGIDAAAAVGTYEPTFICDYQSPSAIYGKITTMTYHNVLYAVWVGPSNAIPSGYDLMGNNCTQTGFPAGTVNRARAIAIGDIVTLKTDLADADWTALDNYVTTQNSEWLRGILKDTCNGSNNPAKCYAELQVAAQQLEGPAIVEGGVTTKTSTYTRPDGAMGTRVEQEHTTFGLNYGPDYFDYTTTTTNTTTEDGTQTGQTTQTDTPDVTQEEPKTDQQDEEEEKPPEREAAGDECDAPLTCSGDAIDCAVLTQDKALRCAYEKQNDYDKHKDEIKTAVTGQKFEIDDSTEVQIPSFINQGTRFLPAACPADKSFSLQTGGGRTFTLTYGPLCSLATDLGYLIVIAVGCFCVLYVGRSLGGE
ncbi:virulence factor TspB C-terminal domain-related protein [Pseudomonas knackmussii]|uniref:virulence factor TspB C-terminal domain-related protein n=1 Tax=Pseudomonas knackmussii TaxID=65741 RepID=UPI003F49BB51